VFPVFDGESLVALLYLDDAEPRSCPSSDLERLAKLSRILSGGRARGATPAAEHPPPMDRDRWETYLERTPVQDIEREKLLLLLNRNEWTIARVARLMGLTRRTVYRRLRDYDIPRERVPKTPPRKKPVLV
jgi:DNA-binding NtrC family response regulator